MFLGLDVGSTITKVVIRDSDEKILTSIIKRTEAVHRKLAHKVVEEALTKSGLDITQIDYIVATGYGRVNVPFADHQVSEITCHLRGVNFLFPEARTIIDIGGQDIKGIKVINGKMGTFIMNDKCAAGTGRFLEVIAEALGVEIENIGELSIKSDDPAGISNICTVFAEQEAMLRLSEGVSLEDIFAGIHEALARKIYTLISKINVQPDVIVTGGGAKNRGLLKYLEKEIGYPIYTPEEPFLTGALGASIMAQRYAEKLEKEGGLPDKTKRKLEEIQLYN